MWRGVAFSLLILLVCSTGVRAENKQVPKDTGSTITIEISKPSLVVPSQMHMKSDDGATPSLLGDTTPKLPPPAKKKPGRPFDPVDNNSAGPLPVKEKRQRQTPDSSNNPGGGEHTSREPGRPGGMHINVGKDTVEFEDAGMLPDNVESRIHAAFPRSDAVLQEPAYSSAVDSVNNDPLNTVVGKQLAVFELGAATEADINKSLVDAGIKVTGSYTLESIGLSVYAIVSSSQVAEQATDKLTGQGLLYIQPDYIYRTLQDPLDHLQQIRKVIDFDLVHHELTGKDINIGVVDTGVDQNHPDLTGAISDQKNFLPSPQSSPEIHGTAVTGLIASREDGSGISGISPQASISSLRACRQPDSKSAAGECYSSSVSQALDYALLNSLDIINLSIGTTGVDPLLVRLIDSAVAKGIVIVAAAGNNPDQREIQFPASHAGVVSIAGIDRSGQPLPNAQIAAQASIVLPSVHLFTTVPGGRYNFLSGTSLATAIGTGVLALYLEREGRKIDVMEIPRSNQLCMWVGDLLQVAACP